MSWNQCPGAQCSLSKDRFHGCNRAAASDTGPTSSVVDEAICAMPHTRRRRRRRREGDGIQESIRPPPHPNPTMGQPLAPREDQATAGMRKRAPTHFSVPHCTAPEAHWSSRGWNADIMQPETHSPPFIGRNQARFPKLSRFPGRGNDGGVIQHEPKFPSHAPRFSQSLPKSRGCDDSLGMQQHTRDSCVLEVFPRQVAANPSLPARQPVRCGILRA